MYIRHRVDVLNASSSGSLFTVVVSCKPTKERKSLPDWDLFCARIDISTDRVNPAYMASIPSVASGAAGLTPPGDLGNLASALPFSRIRRHYPIGRLLRTPTRLKQGS